jgi:Dehydrogenases with different specificities (related to short-chain alcohol dehydrogenases)
MAGRLKDKVAIVTGAGSRGPGIGNGKATAILFAREGAKVLCVDADEARARETVDLIEKENGTAEAFAADVTSAADCKAMVAQAVKTWGGLDILHNNVGVESRLDLMETTEQEWDRVMAIDLKSMLLATQAAVPAMEKRGAGAITCVSSIAALVGHGRTAYAAAKAGVIGFTKVMAREGARFGITANAIAPGPIETPLLMRAKELGEIGEKIIETMKAGTQLGRLGQPEEVAAAVAFLASDDASYVTGETLGVSGGLGMV